MVKVKFEEMKDVRNLFEEDYIVKKEDGDWIVILGRGSCRSGGYGILLKNVSLENGELRVIIKFIDPKPGAFVTMAITYPTRKYRLMIDDEFIKVNFENEFGDILKVINI